VYNIGNRIDANAIAYRIAKYTTTHTLCGDFSVLNNIILRTFTIVLFCPIDET